MGLLAKLKVRFAAKELPEHLKLGKLGEREAKKYLQRQGMKFLAANFRSARGEIDLVFRADASSSEPSNKGKGSSPFSPDRLLAYPGILPKRLKIRFPKIIASQTDCLVFVEVKTRSSEEWMRPAAAVDAERRRRLTRAGLDYLRLLKNPSVKVRFDIVEVLVAEGQVHEVRHLPNAFPMERPYRYA